MSVQLPLGPQFYPIGDPRHNCFVTDLSRLPDGYKLDVNHPRQLVPFPTHGHLQAMEVCDRCWVRATTSHSITSINRSAAWRALTNQELEMMAAYFNGDPSSNAQNHPLFDTIYPVAVREQRQVVTIVKHYAVRGRVTKLRYLVEYNTPEELFNYRYVYADQPTILTYQQGQECLDAYWYGPKPHQISAAFCRTLLRSQGPMTNSAIWGHLPHDEASCLIHLYRLRKLEQWVSGLTVPLYEAIVGVA